MKLLLITGHFPPAPSIAAVRTGNFAKYLQRAGWDVTVVAPHPSIHRKPEAERIAEVRMLETPYRWPAFWYTNFPDAGLYRFFFLVFRRLAYALGFDAEKAWIAEAEKVCASLTKDDVDVVVASAPPFLTFELAERVAKRLGKPFVLDYRDSWTDNPHAWWIPVTKKTLDAQSRMLAHCAAALTVSPSLAELVRMRGADRAKVHVVPNGFDPESCANVTPHDFGDEFAIVYAGKFYARSILIDPLFDALARVRGRWRFHYYGRDSAHVLRAAKRFDVRDRVVVHGHVPRAEALAAVAGAKLAVVITSVREHPRPADRAIITGKLFEPIGLRTPVLLIAPEGSDVETIVARTGLAATFPAQKTAEITAFVESLIAGAPPPAAREPDAYAWSEIVKTADAVLRAVIG